MDRRYTVLGGGGLAPRESTKKSDGELLSVVEEMDETRVVETLAIQIYESRNLAIRSGTGRGKGVFCRILIDSEELYRTGVTELSSNPIFNDHCRCTIPSDFRYLTFYVCEQKPDRSGRPIGRVALRKRDLHKYHGVDNWFQLRRVTDEKTEVTGKVCLELRTDRAILATKPSANGSGTYRLTVKILDVADFAIDPSKHGDLYALVSLCYPSDNAYEELERGDLKRLRFKRDLMNQEYATFDVLNTDPLPILRQVNSSDPYVVLEPATGPYHNPSVRLAIWHDIPGSFSSFFHGEVRVALDPDVLTRPYQAWYCLRPRDSVRGPKMSGNRRKYSLSSSGGIPDDLGGIRVKLTYSVDVILPDLCYRGLKNLIVAAADVKPITCSPVYLMGMVMNNMEDFARATVKVLLPSGHLLPLIESLAVDYMHNASDMNTLFRGSSLVTACVEEVMKLVGVDYIHFTLKACIDQIFEENKCCEVDPNRLQPGDSMALNLMALTVYTEKIFFAIVNSSDRCPLVMSEIFSVMCRLATQMSRSVVPLSNMIVSTFIILRFFAPALQNPKLFDLRRDNPSPNVSRTMTLISKTIQRMCNLSICGMLTTKEPFMAPLMKNFSDERHKIAMRMFLEKISSVSRNHFERLTSGLVIKEGFLDKLVKRRVLLLEKLLKPKFSSKFVTLTDKELIYCKTKDSSKQDSILLKDVLAIRRVAENVFQDRFVFQISLSNSENVVLRAANYMDELEWLSVLDKLRHKLLRGSIRTTGCCKKFFHPGEFKSNCWTCCHSNGAKSQGCSTVVISPSCVKHDTNSQRSDVESETECCDWLQQSAAGVRNSQLVDLDQELELERLHSLTVEHCGKLLKLRNILMIHSENPAAQLNLNGEAELIQRLCKDRSDQQVLLHNLESLLLVVLELEEQHKVFIKQRLRCLRYGSREVPIGDDNYLLLKAKEANYQEIFLRRNDFQ